MNHRIAQLALFSLIVIAACSPSRRVVEVTEVDRPPDVVSDSLEIEVERARVEHVQPARPTPNVAEERSIDLQSTVLDLAFDYEEHAVFGTAEVRVLSIKDQLESFYLHAVGMEIEGVESLLETGRGPVPVSFTYDGSRLTIVPSRPLLFEEALRVLITYRAYPMETRGQSGLAFSGYGLYFIDPEDNDPYRPTQIWTQGQTENNRRWFPTWDYPNDKQTIDVSLTVPDRFHTFGNGNLIESEPAGNGLRRDRWVLDGIPTSTYLTAFVVGDFAVVEDEYVREDSTSVPLSYIVEHPFADDAMRIFGETPDMIRVFEEETGVRYPWPNYKQAAVRDFTAGGMENTTITILHEGVQTEERGYLDYTARDLISHELAHQWFGNLATAEDWANLAINESFASYLEEIYLEETYGRDVAQEHGISDRNLYLDQAEELRRPIVWYGYAQEGQMFDRHTYQKGGQVLNQLRFEVGDEIWRRGLNIFLTRHAGRPVEVDDLREAMEEASGRSLRRFFSQWFYNPGHPELDVEQGYFSGSNVYTVQVTQIQDQEEEPVFSFDVNIELNYPNAPRELHRVHVEAADTTFRFNVPEKPSFVRFDEGNWLFAEIHLTQPIEEQVAMASEDDEMAGRYDAVVALGARPESPLVRQALTNALSDPYPIVRLKAAESLERYLRSPGVADALGRRARDEDPRVRREAARVLAGTENVGLLRGVLLGALRDSSYRVVAQGIELITQEFPDQAYEAFTDEGLFDVTGSRGVVDLALIEALGMLSEERGAPYLLDRVGPNNPDRVRTAAIAGITPLALEHVTLREDVSNALVSLIADRLVEVRLQAVRGLSRLGNEEHIDALEARLEAEDVSEVQDAIREALREIRGRATGTQLGGNQP
ncbi:MAG: M1 family aminopeptidase [Rubricoccaceae bacterium]|nr:M1 family aminopeptidase [Rubricoccaceae bacterium]